MAISSINPSNAAFAPAAAGRNKAAVPPVADTVADAPSAIVHLSNGVGSSIMEGNTGSLSAVPLAAEWAPQMLVQGDADQDLQLDTEEFAHQLQRAGVAVEAAKKLFSSFDTSNNGLLSVGEFAQGVNASVADGATLFSTLADSYIRDAAGNIAPAAMGDFLEKGRALAEQYARQSGQSR